MNGTANDPARPSNVSFPSSPEYWPDGRGEPVDSRHAMLALSTGVSDVWNVLPLTGVAEDAPPNTFPLRIYEVTPLSDDPNERPSGAAEDATTDLAIATTDLATGIAMALKAALRDQIETGPTPEPDDIAWARNLLAWVGDFLDTAEPEPAADA